MARGVTGAARLPPSRPCCCHGNRSRATPQDLSLSHPALASSSSARPPLSGAGLLGTLPGPAPSEMGGGPSGPAPSTQAQPARPRPHATPPASPTCVLPTAPPATPCPAPLCTPAPSRSSEAPSHAQLFSRLAPWSLPSCPGSTQLVRTHDSGLPLEGLTPVSTRAGRRLPRSLPAPTSPCLRGWISNLVPALGILPSPHPEPAGPLRSTREAVRGEDSHSPAHCHGNKPPRRDGRPLCLAR